MKHFNAKKCTLKLGEVKIFCVTCGKVVIKESKNVSDELFKFMLNHVICLCNGETGKFTFPGFIPITKRFSFITIEVTNAEKKDLL